VTTPQVESSTRQERISNPASGFATAYAPVLKALEQNEVFLPSALSLALGKETSTWTLSEIVQIHTVLTGGLAEAVYDAGYDPDLLPKPPPRLLELSGPTQPGVPPVLWLYNAHASSSFAEKVKVIPGQTWDGSHNRWRIVALPGSLGALRELVRSQDVKITTSAAEALKKVAADPDSYSLGVVGLTANGRPRVSFHVPFPEVADAFKRIPAMKWDPAAESYTAPATRLREVIQVGERFGFTILEETQNKIAELDATFPYDGTLDGLRKVPLSELSCIDPKKAEKFAEFGVTSIFDLLFLIPRRYLDRSNLTPIRDLKEGDEVGLLATITQLSVDPRKRIVKIQVADGTGRLPITYFNAIWQAKRFRIGDEVSIYGKVEAWTGGTRRVLSITNPVMDPVGDNTLPVIPIYPQSGKSRITTWELHVAVTEAIRRLGVLADPLPEEIRERLEIIPRQEAFAYVHLPANLDQAASGRQRLAFDELFRMQASLLLTKAAEESEIGIAHKPTGKLTQQLVDELPYPLTQAQTKVFAEIEKKLKSPHPMHLLLQGDVGAGKTVCAAATLLSAVESGFQGALMAPTEILATQLYSELQERTSSFVLPDGITPLRVEFFSNKLRGKKREAIIADLAAGNIHIAVGTHALLVSDVEFDNLGVVVVDEQHRFGVEQRASLRAKGPEREVNGETVNVRPDMLVMTATPIPRTAAMTVFGDLDVAVLDELPPGRTPIETSWIDSAPVLDSDQVDPWPLVREQVAAGRQAYVVCPLVEESEKMQVASAVETFESLSAGALKGLRVGLVHGQQRGEEREETMAAFRSGNLDVLVATTVIEVGVNVPNATVIAILDCSRFGIAQLHQLRGRVGRGTHASYCVLLGRCVSSDARTRMQALCDSTDGFYLSEVDLELRGHGSVFGTAQSGVSDLRVADLNSDRSLLFLARETATEILEDDPALQKQSTLRSEILHVLGSDAQEWLTKS